MNKEWSELNKTLQQQLKKKDSYEDGVSTLGLWVFFPISLVVLCQDLAQNKMRNFSL